MNHSESRLLIGLMCGTSGDGVSSALVETAGFGRQRQVQVLAHEVLAYPHDVRERLFAMFPPNPFTAHDLGHLHRDLGILLADAALHVLEAGGHRPDELTAIAVQAPTLYHEPPSSAHLGVHIEIGEAAIIADRTGVTVVSDLRPSDIAAGGHGAPLSAFVDWALFTDDRRCRAVQNIGGIANVTYLPPKAQLDQIASFDTGPGNMVIDGIVTVLTDGRENFDRDGERAVRGRVDDRLLEEMLSHPYLARHPPKTTGREDFGQYFADGIVRRARELGLSGDDLVTTTTAYTAECIRLHYDRELKPRGALDEVILYGGGARNPTLVAMIRDRIAPTSIRFQDEFGIPCDAREAASWAILADESLAGHSANVPTASGANHSVLLGKIVRTRPDGAP